MLGQRFIQSQTQQLNLTYSLRQSIQLLQFDIEDLDKYLNEAALNNPLLIIRKKSSSVVTQDDFFEQLSAPEKESLVEYVQEQISMNRYDTRMHEMLLVLSDSLDDKGYLVARPSVLLKDFYTNQIEIDNVMKCFGQLDPPGLGARNLQESIIKQLEGSTEKGTLLYLVRNYYNDFVNHRWSRITSRTELNEKEIQDLFDQLKVLSPYPAYGFSDTQNIYICPSLIVQNNAGNMKVILGPGERDSIDFSYADYDRYHINSTEIVNKYLSAQLENYHFILSSLAHRRRTILRIGEVVLNSQYAFFKSQGQAQINPLLLKEVAQQLSLNPSTVSRAIRGKYIQTSFGNYPLRHFFGRSLSPQQKISTNEIKEILSNLIENENSNEPYTDAQLVECLKNKQIKIARRTVAKYREQLGFLKSKRRKRV